ncbi:ABC transporter substrate-binding protein [Georgenia yuyongxinii]|uniref:Extracellular solute-binding protein n=1 Tax=Georgenia yuyongxinii TaxID=2589797 RepID=A0A552WWE8_9MICO|nr:extracellular solute-binding protein [Georgenia yuyongxinii]TRW47114.1 extracellular solute-binding protein [Georgenia yuyongxinii]
MRAGTRSKVTAGTAVAGALLLLAACGGGGDGDGDGGTATTGGGSEDISGESVSFIGSWSGDEQDSFKAMVKPWEDDTGATVEYTGSRDLSQQITTGIASGNLPDVAGLPGPGPMKDWYDQGALQPLDFVDFDTYSGATPEGFADLGKAADDTLVGVFTKAAVKGLIYYNTAVWTGDAPTSWDQMISTADGLGGPDTATWCIGLESGATSGWPGTDWIEDIVLRQAGPDAYDSWVNGETKWTSDEIKSAFETFGDALGSSYGGSDYIVNTAFGRAANPMFEDPPGCVLHHQASFITDFFANEAGATPDQYNFFPFPDIDPQFAGGVVGGGDLIGMFNDTPAARSLVEYLLTPEAQQIWVERGGFISANSGVPLDVYPDETSRRSAEILQNAETFRFDGSDNMPAAMTDAFNRAMVAFAQNPDKLDSILSELDTVQADSYNQ